MVSMFLFGLFVLLNTLSFMYLKRSDGWTFLDSLYFTTITLLTVGLGDLAPQPHPTYYMIAWCFLTMCARRHPHGQRVGASCER